MSSNNSGSMVDSILSTNNMSYGLPPMPSLATSRTQITIFPQTVSASAGGNIIFNISSGDQFIYGPGSYLEFRLETVNGDANTVLPSVGSLFNNVVVTARNGVELCRVNELAMYMKKRKWQMSHPKAQLLRNSEGLYRNVGADASLKLILRLDVIPIFNNYNLLPSQMMEGLRIQFGLNSTARAFFSPNTDVTNFSVTSSLKLDAITLADAFLRRVTELSSKEGLVVMHEEPFHSQNSSGTVNLNFAVNKACSKATEFVVISRDAAAVDSKVVDSYSSRPYDFAAVQLQAGSVYYPIQPLLNAATNEDESVEPYHYTLINMAPDYECSVQYNHFYQAGVDGCDALFGQNLKENNRQQMSGILLNNSRSLLVNAVMNSAGNRVFTSYLSHIRLVRIFSNNVVVRD